MQRAAPKHSLNPVFTGEQMRAEIKTLGASWPSPDPRKIAADIDRPAGARSFQRSPNGRHLHSLPPLGASRALPTLCPSPQLTLRVHCAFQVAASNRHREATCELLTSIVHDPRSRLLALEPEAVRTTPPSSRGRSPERGLPCRPSPCMRMRARCTCSALPGHQRPAAGEVSGHLWEEIGPGAEEFCGARQSLCGLNTAAPAAPSGSPGLTWPSGVGRGLSWTLGSTGVRAAPGGSSSSGWCSWLVRCCLPLGTDAAGGRDGGASELGLRTGWRRGKGGVPYTSTPGLPWPPCCSPGGNIWS